MHYSRRTTYKANRPGSKRAWRPITDHHTEESFNLLPNLEPNNTDIIQEEDTIPIDILPDEMHEKILSHLPLSATFKASGVCKRWHQIVHSKNFSLQDANFLAQKPWYFMFESMGYLYDPGHRKWFKCELPFMVDHNWTIASSCGLVCFMDDRTSNQMYICNPITWEYEILENPPKPDCLVINTAMAFSVDRSKSKYTISMVRSTSEDNLFWDVSIHIYDSSEKTWLPPERGIMEGWTPLEVSVISDNILYILVRRTWLNEVENSYGLITYNLDDTETTSMASLMAESVISAPSGVSSVKLLNVQRKIVLVGGIKRPDRPEIITGIGVWVLDGRGWVEITRVPHQYARSFGKVYEFSSSGGGDLIYIQRCGRTALLVYDMSARRWFWSRKGKKSIEFPVYGFSGCCFEPRLR